MLLDKPTYQRVDSKRNFTVGSLVIVGAVAAAVALYSTSGVKSEPVNQNIVMVQSTECPAFTDLEWKGVKMGMKVLDANKYGVLTSYIKVQGDSAKQAVFNQLDLNHDGVVDMSEICTVSSKARSAVPIGLLQYASYEFCPFVRDQGEWDELVDTFTSKDANNDGEISLEELLNSMNSHSNRYTLDDAVRRFISLDLNGDGILDLDDPCLYMYNRYNNSLLSFFSQ